MFIGSTNFLWHITAPRMLFSSKVAGYVLIQRVGIRYSNIVPVQDSRTLRPEYCVCPLPRRNQLVCGMSPFAMAIKKAEIHLLGHFFGLASKHKQFLAEGSGANAALLNGVLQGLDFFVLGLVS